MSWLSDRLEEVYNQVKVGDNKTASTVRSNRNQAQAAQTVRKKKQEETLAPLRDRAARNQQQKLASGRTNNAQFNRQMRNIYPAQAPKQNFLERNVVDRFSPNTATDKYKRNLQVNDEMWKYEQGLRKQVPLPYHPAVVDGLVEQAVNDRRNLVTDAANRTGLINTAKDLVNPNTAKDKLNRLDSGREEAYVNKAFTEDLTSGLRGAGGATAQLSTLPDRAVQMFGGFLQADPGRYALNAVPFWNVSKQQSQQWGRNVENLGDRVGDRKAQIINESRLGKKADDGFAYDVGSATSSLVTSAGLTLATGNPGAAAALFMGRAGGEHYDQARESGANVTTSLVSGLVGAGVEGGLEYVGVGKYFKGAGGGIIKDFVSRMATEAAQEFSQSMGGAVVSDIYKDVDYEKAFNDALVEGGYGGLLGGVGSIPTSIAQSLSNDPNVMRQTKQNIQKQLAEKAKQTKQKASDALIPKDMLDLRTQYQKAYDVETNPKNKKEIAKGIKELNDDIRKRSKGGFIAGPGAKGYDSAKLAGREFVGVDGKPRFEVDDSGAKLKTTDKWAQAYNGEPVGLGSLLDHKKLFDQYPELKDNTIVKFGDLNGARGTMKNENGVNFITLDKKLFMNNFDTEGKSTLIHEIQHAIQKKEGFARGGSDTEFGIPMQKKYDQLNAQLTDYNKRLSDAVGKPEYNDIMNEKLDLVKEIQKLEGKQTGTIQEKAIGEYSKLAGEAEARAVASRMNMTEGERYAKDTKFKNSKVKDKVYHQTDSDFTEFRDSGDPLRFKNAHFFLDTKPETLVKKNLVEANVGLNNPKTFKDTNVTQPLVDKLRKEGYDGIINELPASDKFPKRREIVVFDPKNIETAGQQNVRSTFYDSLDVPKKDLIVRDNNGVGGGKAMSILSEEQRADFINPRTNSQILPNSYLKNPKTVYRGVSESGDGIGASGGGAAVEGYGLYTTTKKQVAKGYAGKTGEVLELEPTNNIPSNPLYFRDSDSVRDWQYLTSKKLGIDPKKFETEYGINKLVNDLGYDGVAFDMNGGTTFVKYPESTQSNVSMSVDKGMGENAPTPKAPVESKPAPKPTLQDALDGKRTKTKKTPLKFIETAKESRYTAPELKKKLKTITAETIGNKDTLAVASEAIKQQGFDQAVQEAKTSKTYNLETQAKSLVLIEELQKQDRVDEALEVIQATSERAREGGQATQILAAYNRLTPEGIVRAAYNEAEKFNRSKRGRKRADKKGKITVTEQQANKLRKMAEEVQAMPDGEAKVNATLKLQQEIAAVVPTPANRKGLTLWKAGLLTGVKGAIGGNSLGNASFQLMKKVADVPAAGLDAAVAQATGNRSKLFTFRGMFSGGIDGFKEGFTNMKNRRGAGDLEVKFDYVPVRYSDTRRGRAAQAYTDFVFNAYSALDRPFFHSALRNSLTERAMVEAKNKGLKGEDARAYVRETIKNPPEDMNVAANDDALTLVFQNKGFISGALSDVKKRARDSGAVAETASEVIFPFTGVPSNIASAITQYNPIAAAMGAKDVFNVIKNSNTEKYSQEAQRKAVEKVGKGVSGTGVMWLGAQLMGAGLMTLGYPPDDDERALWEAEGKQPYSIKINGKWRSMNYLGPLTSLMGAGGYYQQSSENEGGAVGSTASAAAGAIQTTLEASPLRGFSDAMDAVNAYKVKDKAGKEAGFSGAGTRYINSLAGSTVPTLSNDIGGAIDPYERQVNTAADAVKNRIPFLSQTLDKQVDAFGRPIKNRTPGISSIIDPLRSRSGNPNDVDKEIRRLRDSKDVEGKITPPGIVASSWGHDKLTRGQADSIKSAVYPEIQDRWAEVIKQKTYQGLSNEDKAKLLDKEKDAILKKRREEYKALDDEGKKKYIENGIINHINTNAVNEKGFLNMISTNASAWANDPAKAFSYLGKEKILRTDNGAIIIERLSSSDSGKIRDARGATTEVKLDHTVPLQIGGDNSEGNLKLVPTDVHKGYNAMENEVARRLRAGRISGPQAKKDILALKNGDITLEKYIGAAPGGVGKVSSTGSTNQGTSQTGSPQTGTYQKYGLAPIPDNDTIVDLRTKFDEKVADGRITDINRDSEERNLAKNSYKAQFDDTTSKFYRLNDDEMRTAIQGGKMTKAQLDKAIEVDNALTEAGLQPYLQIGKTLRKELGYGAPTSSKSGGGRRTSKSGGRKSGGRKSSRKNFDMFGFGSNPTSVNNSLISLLNKYTELG